MEKIKFSDFEVIPVMDSIKNLNINDDEYFSSKFKKYVSNSKLKFIDPLEGGSPEVYTNPPVFTSQSLMIGSAVHEVLLQPEEFTLGPKLNRPTAKLGSAIDLIFRYRNKGMSIHKSIALACKKADYYADSYETKIKNIFEKGLKYYMNLLHHENKTNKSEIFLSDKDFEIVSGCLNSCYNNKKLMDHLHPVNLFSIECESHNEDALFIDFIVTYKDKYFSRIPFKLKIDNWTIDPESQVITLNDLKTTGKPVAWFMNLEYGSMQKFHYYRQMAVYGDILWWYCNNKFGACKETGWTLKHNMLVVQTLDPYSSSCFPVSENFIRKGRKEYKELLKRIAYYSIFGFDKEVEFV